MLEKCQRLDLTIFYFIRAMRPMAIERSKTAPRILIFLIALGAEYSFYVKSIPTYDP